MQITNWISDNYIEIFGAVTGILYIFLEIRQNIWLWPVGIVTSAVYIWIFFTSKFYADMSLQEYYLVISVLGWYWWIRGGRQQATGDRKKGSGLRAQSERQKDETERLPSLESLSRDSRRLGVGNGVHKRLKVTRINVKTTLILAAVFIVLTGVMYLVLDRLTDSPVPGWDAFITSLSIIATWMLARKIYEHWYLWIVVNTASVILFYTRGLYPTVVLYIVYFTMSFVGLKEWKKSL
ncbi:MAG: nicotinamide riboside transporter PnuC [Bacteroidota bacterium]